ncbi:hypothetical protein PAEPH01_2147 [Pancytospora epiphaga]|nr:hypothetical protein PAEPH01_2147 [Pancytospora epiphaga]
MIYYSYVRINLLRVVRLFHKYDVLANKLGQEYGCRTRIIPYVMTWDGVVTKYHRRHSKDIGIIDFI